MTAVEDAWPIGMGRFTPIAVNHYERQLFTPEGA
jgi:hypothetical protein